MVDTKSQCWRCAYKAAVPGSCHIRCVYNWAKSEHRPPRGKEYGIDSGWYYFPLNYDPVWMIDGCQARADEREPEMVGPDNPMLDLLSIMARTWR